MRAESTTGEVKRSGKDRGSTRGSAREKIPQGNVRKKRKREDPLDSVNRRGGNHACLLFHIKGRKKRKSQGRKNRVWEKNAIQRRHPSPNARVNDQGVGLLKLGCPKNEKLDRAPERTRKSWVYEIAIMGRPKRG